MKKSESRRQHESRPRPERVTQVEAFMSRQDLELEQRQEQARSGAGRSRQALEKEQGGKCALGSADDDCTTAVLAG